MTNQRVPISVNKKERQEMCRSVKAAPATSQNEISIFQLPDVPLSIQDGALIQTMTMKSATFVSALLKILLPIDRSWYIMHRRMEAIGEKNGFLSLSDVVFVRPCSAGT